MLVCNSPPFVGILPSKTGTRSVHYLLRSRFPLYSLDPHHGVAPEIKAYAKHFTFCTVRSPFSRMVSYWRHVRRRESIPPGSDDARIRLTEEANETDFATFVQKWVLLPISEEIRGVRVDYLIRMEQFVHDVRHLPFPGMAKIAVPHEHKSLEGDWRELYKSQPVVIDWVRDRYREDFDQFGYSMEIPW